MNLTQSILAIALGTVVYGQAQAGFFVNDDSPVIAVINQDAARKDKTIYASFVNARLQGTSRGELETAAETLNNVGSVVITTYARTAKQMPAANRRITAVKAILIRKGFPADKLTGNAELDPQADALDSDVQVTFRSTPITNIDAIRARRLATVAVASAQPLPAPAPAYTYAATAAAPPVVAQQSQSAAKLEFVKKIMSMASNKLISQESAVKLVNEYLANMAPVSAQTTMGDAPRPTAPIIPITPQIVPFGEVPQVWTLAANKSLRDNIRDWSIAAGYGEPNWAASNLYQVTYTSTYTGTFLEVLNQVSNAVPAVDFKISRNARRIEVVDHL